MDNKKMSNFKTPAYRQTGKVQKKFKYLAKPI